MATNHTENYALNLWTPQDSFLREEFNENTQKLDAAVAGKFGTDNMPWVMGMYTGSGTESSRTQEITLGFRPKLLIIVGSGSFGAAAVFGESSTSSSVVAATSSNNSSLSASEITLTDDGFRVTRASMYGPTINYISGKYIYFAMR